VKARSESAAEQRNDRNIVVQGASSNQDGAFLLVQFLNEIFSVAFFGGRFLLWGSKRISMGFWFGVCCLVFDFFCGGWCVVAPGKLTELAEKIKAAL
jgi:hypothetical protein